jgi:hypothetical protein
VGIDSAATRPVCIAKYGDLTVVFYAENATFRVEPATVFSLTEADFNGLPTRWRF